MINNIMSVDLEDYFCDLPIDKWEDHESRIVQTTIPMLELFKKYDVKATFFVVGYFAEKFPDLIKKIHDDGHEIGTHTFSHIDLRKSKKSEIISDLEKSITAIESITGEKILGFRAPFFSINENNAWVFDILKKQINSNRLIIFATHNRFFAKKSDCMLEIVNGSIKTINARV